VAFDVGAEMRDVARALNRVKVNAAAAAAAAAAVEHGRRMASDAESLPDLFRGAAAGSLLARNVRAAVQDVETARRDFVAPSLAASAVGPGWTSLRRRIERVYIEGAAVYAVKEFEGASTFQSLVGDLEQKLVRYGKVIEKKGVVAGAGMIIGDTARAVGEGAKEVGTGVTDAAGSLFAGWWPLLVVGGVVVAAYVFGPALIARKVAA
jgi:hypothetical protein